MMRSRPWLGNWAAPAIILLAFALRIYLLDNQSFAIDEGWTSYIIRHSWGEMWRVMAPDNHPPLYYVLVKAWANVAGYGDFPVRLFSVFCGTAMIAGLYVLGQRLGGHVTGLAAALCAACLPSFVYYAQEARMYSLLMALGVLSSYCLVRIADDPGRLRWWIGYVAAMAGALYTQYFAVLIMIAHNIAVFVRIAWLFAARRRAGRAGRVAGSLRRRLVQGWLLSQGAILTLYLPWLPTAIQQIGIGQGTWWRVALPPGMILTDLWLFWVLGPNRPLSLPWFGLLTNGMLLAALVSLLLGWRGRVGRWAFVWSLLAAPAALVVALGSWLPVYTDRYTLVAAPGLALAVGLGVSACWGALSERTPGRRRAAYLGRAAALMMLLSALVGPLPQLNAYYHQEDYWREDFRRAANYVMDTAGQGDAVVLLGCYQPIMQYYRGAATVVRFPQQGDSVQSEEEVVAQLNAAISSQSRVRLVMYSWPTVDPQDLVEGMLRAQCRLQGEHWQRETGQRPIKVLNFEACASFLVEPRQPLDAVWGEQVALTAYRLVHFEPGRQAHLFLWWKALHRPDENYSAFVHLLDAEGQMITQFDHLPLSDFYPMQAWPLDVPLRDDYPLNISARHSLDGAWLAVGIYDRSTMQRLPVVQDGMAVGDFIRIPIQ